MGHHASTHWLQDALPAPGCTGCLGRDARPACRSQVEARACTDPQLAGPGPLVQQTLQALNDGVVDTATGRGIVDLQWVQALRIEGGEAELVLGFAPSCGPAKALADNAFQTLRRVLPDTDVYVHHNA